MKNSFTLIEALMAILLLSVLFTASIKTVNYIYDINFLNEIRYLTLNRLDSEMARVVAYYKHIPSLEINIVDSKNIYPVSKRDEIKGDNTNGLKIESNRNIVEIKNIDSDGVVLDSDIVGLLSWESTNYLNEYNLSLNIEYPYRYKNGTLEKILNFTETINLKTSVLR